MNSPLNILLAEDERSVALSISFALKADGHKIEMVSDGEEALSELTRKPGAFDLLITDHSMPRMNGIELVRRLRDTAFRGKIVVLSAHLSAENRAAYLALGVDMMVPKPFDVHQLRASDIIQRISATQRGGITAAVNDAHIEERQGLAGTPEIIRFRRTSSTKSPQGALSLNPILRAIPSKSRAGSASGVSPFLRWDSTCHFRFVELANGRCLPFPRVAPE
jgi:DNA-binding response OmpR family regulator